MRVLVTGGSGFIGSRVVEQLAVCRDIELYALVRPSSDLCRLRMAGMFQTGSRVRAVVGDFCVAPQREAMLRDVRPEVLIHLAMVYHTLGSTGGAAVDAVNRQGTIDLLEAFRASGGRRFVSAGTCFEYGSQEAEQIDEDTVCRPVYDYARAKLEATEAILDRATATGAEALVLRVFAPYGPLEQPSRIVPQLLAAGLAGRRLELTEGRQVRDYVFVEDVAQAFVQAALHSRLPRPRAIYNVCTGVGHSLRQLAAAAQEALDRPLPLEWGKIPYRPGEMMRLVGNPDRIRTDLGWRARCSLADGLRHTLCGLRRRQPA